MISYSRGPDGPLWEMTIGQVLEQTAREHGDSPAVISCHQQERMTWGELRDAALAVARGLWGLGIRRGDRVGIWSTSCLEWVLVHMGCACAGAVLVNVNPAYRSHELRFALRRSRMKAIFLWEKDARADYTEILREARDGQELCLEHAITFGSAAWE